MDLAALIIAIVGLVIAVASLTWQAVTWFYEGARVKVEVTYGLVTCGPELSDQMVIVTATNVGRSPVGVTGWGFDLGGGKTMIVREPVPGSTDLPTTLAGGHGAKWFVPLDEVRAGMQRAGVRSAVPIVNLGTGNKAQGKPWSPF